MMALATWVENGFSMDEISKSLERLTFDSNPYLAQVRKGPCLNLKNIFKVYTNPVNLLNEKAVVGSHAIVKHQLSTFMVTLWPSHALSADGIA